MIKVCCIFGTRPETIKMAPVIHQLQQSPHFDVTVVCSGQHRELLTPLIDWFELNIDINLDLMKENQNLNELSSVLLNKFNSLYQANEFDYVIGQGDTTTVLMAALSAFHQGIPFAHVEAGLRTHNIHSPFPEEMNRVVIGKLATLHFCPTQLSMNNLSKDSVMTEQAKLTGNTVIDALMFTMNKLNITPELNQSNPSLLVTSHRRESFGQPLQNTCHALRELAQKHPQIQITYPVHPNPNVKDVVYQTLNDIDNISLIEPQPYEKMIELMAKATLVVTDSGGLQEEAPALNKPVLVLRENTERGEIVELGGAKLVGTNQELIVKTVEELLLNQDRYHDMVLGYSPYGDGKSAQYIHNAIFDYHQAKHKELAHVI